jgi:lipid A 3-O-deacylase
MNLKCLAGILACFMCLHSTAQDSTAGFKSRLPLSSSSLQYDNDFFSATDIYYTQGIRYELVLPVFFKSPLSYLLPHFKEGARNYSGIALEQDCFTPSSIRRDTVFTGDRPFAAIAFGGQFLISNDALHTQRLSSEFDLGILGPCAKCEEEQKGIHRMLVNIQPLGWQFQLKQDVIVSYSLSYDKAIYSARFLELIGQGGFTAGSLYDKIWTGAMLRTGLLNPFFENYIPGETAAARKIHLTGFLKARIQGTAYDATMEGGLFDRNSIYQLAPSSLQRNLYFLQYGLIFTWKRLSLEYSKVLISREFKAGLDHGWGHCDIRFGF